MASDAETLAVVAERNKGKHWTIYVCAEPDGEQCESGTHPNIVRHRCAALTRFHESEGQEPGPRLAEVDVANVDEAIEITDEMVERAVGIYEGLGSPGRRARMRAALEAALDGGESA